jgi:hypothetical protein
MSENDERYQHSQTDRLLKKNDNKPEQAKSLDDSQKGIQLFFGDKERTFFENAGKEITIGVLQESFILYRIDYKRTQTHKLYGESKRKAYLEPVEVFGRVNLIVEDPSFYTKGGITRKDFSKFEAHIYLSHLEELGVIIRNGDYAYHKGNYYEITNDGSADISNEFSFGGDKLFFITVKGVKISKDVFDAI